MTNIVKFPYNACRRVHSRKPRISKNGTPEERAARANAVLSANRVTAANVVQISRKPAKPHTPPTTEKTAEFMALVAQLPESDLPWISDMLRNMKDKNAT
jgi:hypothetical protein